MPPTPGDLLSHFRLVEKIGEGGMGAVWRAEDTTLGREVALKILPDELGADAGLVERLGREARTLASLSHPNIAVLHSLGESDGTRFLTMELVKGKPLDVALRGSPAMDEVLSLCEQIAEALEAAHDGGVIHRDLKPSNVMVTDEGRAKVLDFGLAKQAAPERAADLTSMPTRGQDLTVDGAVIGTVPYMSPEQARGREVDKRTDIWSFGCLLYEALTGARAFAGETMADTVAAVLGREPDWSLLPEELPARVRRLLQRCLRKNPRDRLRDIGDARIVLAEALDEKRSPPGAVATAATAAPRRPVGRRLLASALAAAAVLAVAVVAWRLLPREVVVCLIDTAAPLGVYDQETRSSGGTNADDLTDVLGDLPVTLVKETASPLWHREHQVLMQDPDLVVIHLSAFAHQPGQDDFVELGKDLAALEARGLENPMTLGRSKMVAVLGYLALGNPKTRFLVYSRGAFVVDSERDRWIAEVEARFPQLREKIATYTVPGGPRVATFRDPETAREIRGLVGSLLGLD